MVYFQTIKEILTDPVSALVKSKKEKNINKTLTILFLDWVLFTLSVLVIYRPLATMVPEFSSLLFIPVIFFFGIMASLFFALLTQILFNILGGKGKYFEALTPLAYSKFPLSIGVLIASLLSQVPFVGLLISLIILAIFGVIGISVFYRGIKDMFGIDMVTAWIGIGLLITVIFFSFYVGIVFFGISTKIFSTLPVFPGFLY